MDSDAAYWLSLANSARTWGLWIALIAAAISVAAAISQNRFQSIVNVQKEDELERYKADANARIAEAIRDTAKANQRIAELTGEAKDIKQQIAPRTLSEQQRSNIVATLRKYRGQKFIVLANTNDAESFGFANRVREVLELAGWRFIRLGIVDLTAPAGVTVQATFGESVNIARELVAAFSTSGIAAYRGTTPERYEKDIDSIFVVVGIKP